MFANLLYTSTDTIVIDEVEVPFFRKLCLNIFYIRGYIYVNMVVDEVEV